MGLDQYLTAKKYMSRTFREKDKKIYAALRKLFPEIKDTGNMNFCEVSFEAGYWRKANHIHKWFVDIVQEGKDDCHAYYVSRDNLKELKILCEEVLLDKEKAEELLPTREGFFFGGTEYDECYFEDVKHTIKVINYCLSLPEEWEFEYRASW